MITAILDVVPRSPAWFAARAGRLTGSCAQAMRSGGRDRQEAKGRRELRARLVCEQRFRRSMDEPGFTSPHVRRGIALEPAALSAYEVASGRLVRTAGFLAGVDLMVGCSLDGYVGDLREGILEVKCPKSSTHFAWLQGGLVPPEHRRRIIHNLWVSGAAWCDFVSYDDRFGPTHELFIARMVADPVDLASHEAAALEFLDEVAGDLTRVQAQPRRVFAELLQTSVAARAAVGGGGV